jgi:hypothetical protein
MKSTLILFTILVSVTFATKNKLEAKISCSEFNKNVGQYILNPAIYHIDYLFYAQNCKNFAEIKNSVKFTFFSKKLPINQISTISAFFDQVDFRNHFELYLENIDYFSVVYHFPLSEARAYFAYIDEPYRQFILTKSVIDSHIKLMLGDMKYVDSKIIELKKCKDCSDVLFEIKSTPLFRCSINKRLFKITNEKFKKEKKRELSDILGWNEQCNYLFGDNKVEMLKVCSSKNIFN